MRKALTVLVLAIVVEVLWGCSRSVDPNAVSVGMTADQVRSALGPPIVLGGASSNINGNVTVRENWTYPMGDSGLVIVMENGKVLSRTTRPNLTRAWLRKVRVGMSKQDVITAIGDTVQKLPAGPPNAADKTPTEKWMYTDKEAPIEILMVHFRDNAVVKAECTPNGLYTGQTMPAIPTGPR